MQGRTSLTLAALPQLKTLRLYRMGLTNLGIITSFAGLRELEMQVCLVGQDLRPLGTLTSLEKLGLPVCGLRDVHPISGLTQIKSLLNLRNNYSLASLTPLSGLTGLSTTLDTHGCRTATNLAPLSGLTGLNSLDISWCPVTSLAPLGSLTAGLNSLNMTYCKAVTSLTPLSTLTGLRTLKTFGCTAAGAGAPVVAMPRGGDSTHCETVR
jgi:internalin A